jgi:homogentisate phytyltransferase / homogentisate geranylgeranyltransferase
MRLAQPHAHLLLLLVATLGMCSAFRPTLMIGPHQRMQVRRSAIQSTSSSSLYASHTETTVAAVKKRSAFIKVIWDFSRPHTVIGSTISIVTLFMFAVPPSVWGTMHFMKALLNALVPSVLMNLYITGLNQISDIEIDKVNKPYLPIASGELSKSSAIVIVLAALAGAAALTIKAPWPLFSTVWGSFVLGTLYSLPPFRLKRFPILAAFCILIVRGSLVNFGFFAQAKATVLGSTAGPLSTAMRFPESLLVTVFFAVFGLVIAIMKDVPDVQGDKLFEIPSFSVKKGAALMFR